MELKIGIFPLKSHFCHDYNLYGYFGQDFEICVVLSDPSGTNYPPYRFRPLLIHCTNHVMDMC